MEISQQSERPLALSWHLQAEGSHMQDPFSSALQELRNVKPYLFSAAQYYEAAYLHSYRKNVVIESLKDYTAKALVNVLDHVGSVASQLNECLSLHTANISNMKLRTTTITQKLSACHGRNTCEGLTQLQRTKSRRGRYHKHYYLADSVAENHLRLLQLSPEMLTEIFQSHVGSDSNTLKSLSWYLEFESSSSATAKGLTAMEFKNKELSGQGQFVRSLSSGNPQNQGYGSATKDTSKSLRSLMMSDAEDYEETNLQKNPFASFLVKNRRGKSKSFDLSKNGITFV